MSRKNPPAKWVLPAIIDPPDRLCVKIMVPRERQHIAAFRGALLNLAAAYKWADDEDHTAKAVALVWNDVIAGITVCDETTGVCCPLDEEGFMAQRQEGCLLQSQCADGSWMTIYDPTECIKELIKQAGGSAPSGEIPDGGSNSVCPTLDAQGKYVVPFKVSPGDTVVISQCAGQWFGDNVTQHWYCPDGYQYALGVCLGEFWGPPVLAPAGYPIEGIPVMRPVAQYGPLWFDAFNTTFVIPEDALQSELVFQANDIDLTNNAGHISFCVNVTHPVPTGTEFPGMDWVIPVDLAAIDYSGLFTVLAANGNDPKGYIVGEGLSCGLSGNEIAFDVRLHIAAGAGQVRAIVADVWNTYDSTTSDDGLYAGTNDDITLWSGETLKQFSADTWTIVRVDVPAGEAWLNVGYDTRVSWQVLGSGTPAGASPYGNTIVRKVWIAGTGVMPGLVHS